MDALNQNSPDPIQATAHARDVSKKLPSRDAEKPKKVSQTYWADEQDELFSAVTLQQRWELLRQYGSFSLSYSTAVQPRLLYFGDEHGYIAYRKRWGACFALGDPVAPQERIQKLLTDFLAAHRKPTFCQVSQSTASQLAGLGYNVNEMGVDTRIDLANYEFDGKAKEWLRYAANWSARRKYEVVESTIDEIGEDQIEQVSEAWRKTRTVKRKEVRFLNRPIVVQDEPDVRKFFFLDPDGRLLAYSFLDPIYANGEVTGYVTCIKRRHPDAPLYAEHATMKQIIETLKKDRVPHLYLGLSPMAWIEDEQFKPNWVTGKAFKFCFHSRLINHYFYNLRGHADYKRRFRGVEEKTYFASPARLNSFRLMALVGLCGIA